MSTKLSLLFAYASTTSALLPFIIGWIRFKRNEVYLKLVFALSGISIASDGISMILFQFKINPNYAVNIYRLVEFLILIAIFYQVYDRPKWFTLFISAGLFYALFSLFYFLFPQQYNFNSYPEILSALAFIALSIVYFYRLMNGLTAAGNHQPPMFWICTGILIYFAGNLFLFILSNYLITAKSAYFALYWSFHNFLGIIKNVLFAIGLWQNLRTPKLL